MFETNPILLIAVDVWKDQQPPFFDNLPNQTENNSYVERYLFYNEFLSKKEKYSFYFVVQIFT